MIKTSIGSPKEVLVDDPDEMFQLADLLEGVSVDCAELPLDTPSSGMNDLILMHRIVCKYYFSLFSSFALFFTKIKSI